MLYTDSSPWHILRCCYYWGRTDEVGTKRRILTRLFYRQTSSVQLFSSPNPVTFFVVVLKPNTRWSTSSPFYMYCLLFIVKFASEMEKLHCVSERALKLKGKKNKNRRGDISVRCWCNISDAHEALVSQHHLLTSAKQSLLLSADSPQTLTHVEINLEQKSFQFPSLLFTQMSWWAVHVYHEM